MCLSPFVPESPKHSLITLDQETKSRAAIDFYHGPDADIDAVVDEYRLESLQAGSSQTSICEVLNTRHLRWPFLICVVANVSARTTGYDIDNFYSTQLITDVGVSPDQAALYNLLFLRLPIIAAGLLSLTVVKYVSTSRALLGSLLSLMCVSEAVDWLRPQTSSWSTVLLIVSICIVVSTFHLGGYFYPRILPGEICPQASRSLTSAFAPLATLIGEALTLLPLVMISWMVCVWLFKYLPDTNSKSVNQIVSQWIEEDQVLDPLIEK